MEVQWLIDTAGKIGSATVALAVLAATIAQNRWNITVARRSAAIEDQKVRLALLERRLQLLSDFDAFLDEWRTLGRLDSNTLIAFGRAITTAELIFPTEAEQVVICERRVYAYSGSMRRLNRANRGDDEDERLQAQHDAAQKEVELDQALNTTREKLVKVARVDAVAPLPPPFADRLIQRLSRRRDANHSGD